MFKKSLIFASFLCLLSSCSTQNVETRNYTDYPQNYLSKLEDFYSLDDEEYFIDLYQITCSHCEATKTTIFNYLDDFNNGAKKIPLYLFDINSGNGEANRAMFKELPNWYEESRDYEKIVQEMERVKPNSLDETYYVGTPTLYLIKDNRLERMFVGEREVNGALLNN